MAKYLLLLEGLAAQPAASDAETQAYNRKWAEWIGSLAAAGILDGGAPLEAKATAVSKDAVTDRQLQHRDIYGFLLINAASLDEAANIVRGAPHTELGGTTIIRPCVDLPTS
jgi:hypothetical protein